MTNQSIFESQSLADWLFYLESQHHKEIDLGLERVIDIAKQAQLQDLGDTQIVLVAGTNGKGTTIRFVEQYLLSLGYSVGVYGSPHMHTYHERVRINGEMLPDQEHVQAFSYLESARNGQGLTYFEFGTLAAFKILKEANLDFALIEVGLGGRLDATNILPHDVSVITSLGLDHTDWLGDTIEQIGFEKAGIFRPLKPAIVGLEDVPDTVFEQAKDLGVSELLVRGKDFDVTESETTWTFSYGECSFASLPNTLIPHQNIATGLVALSALGIELKENKVIDVVNNLSLPGRMQIVSEQPLSMVDVAHNAHAVSYLANALVSHPTLSQAKARHAVVAMMADKDIDETLAVIAPLIDHWHVAPLQDNPRAASVEVLQAAINKVSGQKIDLYENIGAAWDSAKRQMNESELLLGFGSFYTVAEILK